MDLSNIVCWIFSTLHITGSSKGGPFNAVTVGGDGTVDGEKAQNEDAFGAPGIVFRPRPPSKVRGEDGQTYKVGAEAIAARMGDRFTPLSWRDLRLNKVFPSPKDGTIAFVGYGGAFLSFDDVQDPAHPTDSTKKLSIATLYVPFDFDADGNARKCHTIVLDPVQDAIGIVHSSGLAISMDTDNGIVMRADEKTFMTMAPGKFKVLAESIVLQGNVALGANTAIAVPLAAGPASPPCPSLFVSPV